MKNKSPKVLFKPDGTIPDGFHIEKTANVAYLVSSNQEIKQLLALKINNYWSILDDLVTGEPLPQEVIENAEQANKQSSSSFSSRETGARCSSKSCIKRC